MLLDAAAGLTRYEAESAFSLSLVRHGRLVPDAVWDLKCQTLKKSGLMQLYRGTEDFSGLGGLTSLKAFTKRALLQPSRSNPLKRPRGVLLLSPPGCGKSQFCKCLGKETGRPVLILDVGTLMGSLVGQTEERTRQALQIADAMSGKTEAGLEIRSLVKTKTPKIEFHGYPARGDVHFRRFFAVVREYLDALDGGRFNYRPGFHCGMCDFATSHCREWDG
jgi:hypothetical protein